MATNAHSFVKRVGINPISVSVFTLFHVGAIASLFFFIAGILCRTSSVLGFFELGQWESDIIVC
jgi:hypothetical protein